MAATELRIAPYLIVIAQDDLVEVDSLEIDYFPPGKPTLRARSPETIGVVTILF